MIITDNELGARLRGCHFHGTYEQWKVARDGLVSYVREANAVLDIGCANGFLLQSLIDWGGRAFIPYGIDVHQHSIDAARAMFPDHAENFVVTDMTTLVWTEQRVDVVLAPWFEHPRFIEAVATYLEKHPEASVVFSVYDDEMDRFDDMVRACRDHFAAVDQVMLRPEWCGLLRVRTRG